MRFCFIWLCDIARAFLVETINTGGPMAKKEIVAYYQQTFENIKHIDENGAEFWYARELQKALEYGKFLPVIEKAIEACRKTGFDEGNHFAHVSEMAQTDDKLRRENIKGKEKANEVHFAVGKKVRQTIAELGGTMPENLPTPKISAKKLKQERKKAIAEK
jgi:hypothetical protein